jgi:ABC-type antimicrobial peptide transport system permease subunit
VASLSFKTPMLHHSNIPVLQIFDLLGRVKTVTGF